MADKPTLHMIGLFHTITNLDYSHCAFTGKVLRFSKMMQMYGYKVIEYSNEGSISTADEHVTIFSTEEFSNLHPKKSVTDFVGDNGTVDNPAHALFEDKLILELQKRVHPQDIICHPFSFVHEKLLDIFPEQQHIESGIGYNTIMDKSYHVFESYAWMHYHQGKRNSGGNNYEWVVPNYFDLDDWEPNYNQGNYIAFLGRISETKGLDVILEIAKILDFPIKIAGQGDPTPWEHKNIEYIGPITGKERSKFLGEAVCTLMPTVYTEPFGGVGIESMLCGTPLIAVDYGAFTETVIEGINGYRCHTLDDWIKNIIASEFLDRKVVADLARSRYNLQICGQQYDKIFTDLQNLYSYGWYTRK